MLRLRTLSLSAAFGMAPVSFALSVAYGEPTGTFGWLDALMF